MITLVRIVLTQTFSGVKGRDALNDFCMWAFDDNISKDAVFIAHNGINHDSQKVGNILQIYIKACESKFIDSFCFLSMYNPPLSEFVEDMTDELGGRYITEYVSNGSKNYVYRTGAGKQVVTVKGFTLNFVASQQLILDVMKEMAIS